jgi:hypothetical protein
LADIEIVRFDGTCTIMIYILLGCGGGGDWWGGRTGKKKEVHIILTIIKNILPFSNHKGMM